MAARRTPGSCIALSHRHTILGLKDISGHANLLYRLHCDMATEEPRFWSSSERSSRTRSRWLWSGLRRTPASR